VADSSFNNGFKPSVLVGVIPLTAVTNFVLSEGYKVSQIAGSSVIAQMLSPTNKTIKIDAQLIGGQRALRPALEALAMTNRVLAAATTPLMKFTGIPVVARLGVHLDMQITSLTFTQDNVNRDTLKLNIEMVNVPRSKLGGLLGGALDLVVGVGSAFV
jgi:hypothetical protein